MVKDTPTDLLSKLRKTQQEIVKLQTAERLVYNKLTEKLNSGETTGDWISDVSLLHLQGDEVNEKVVREFYETLKQGAEEVIVLKEQYSTDALKVHRMFPDNRDSIQSVRAIFTIGTPREPYLLKGDGDIPNLLVPLFPHVCLYGSGVTAPLVSDEIELVGNRNVCVPLSYLFSDKFGPISAHVVSGDYLKDRQLDNLGIDSLFDTKLTDFTYFSGSKDEVLSYLKINTIMAASASRDLLNSRLEETLQ